MLTFTGLPPRSSPNIYQVVLLPRDHRKLISSSAMRTYAQDVLAAYKALCDKKPGSDEKINALVLSSGSCASITNAFVDLTEDTDNLKVGKKWHLDLLH